MKIRVRKNPVRKSADTLKPPVGKAREAPTFERLYAECAYGRQQPCSAIKMKSICNFQKNFSRPHLPPTTDFKSFDYCRWIIIGPNESVLKKEIPTKNVELNNLFKNGKADLLYSNLSFFSGRIKY